MSGPDAARYEDESDLVLKFEELINVINPTINGKNVEQGTRILQIGIRAYFFELGFNVTKIIDSDESRKIIVKGQENIISELPNISHEFQLTDGTLAVSLVDEKIMIYQKVAEGKWLIIATAEVSS